MLARSKLGVNPQRHAVLVSEPPLNAPRSRECLAELLFETFRVPALYVGLQPLLALYGTQARNVLDTLVRLGLQAPLQSLWCACIALRHRSAHRGEQTPCLLHLTNCKHNTTGARCRRHSRPFRQDVIDVVCAQGQEDEVNLDELAARISVTDADLTGVVVDIGEGSTHVVPIVSGYAVDAAVRSAPLAGADVTAFIERSLRRRQQPLPASAAAAWQLCQCASTRSACLRGAALLGLYLR